MTYRTHTALRLFGEKLGYYQNSQGICNGIALSYLEASLTNQGNQYLSMVQRIKSIVENQESEQFLEEITRIKNKVINFSSLSTTKIEEGESTLTNKEKEYLQILAFFERITLYQDPEIHTDIFNSYQLQNYTENISKIASSLAVEEHGGLKQIFTHTNIYTIYELQDFLQQIALIIDTCELKQHEIIGFKLDNISHAIALSYDTFTKTYTLLDSNYEGPITENIEKIADLIFRSFANNTHYRTFNTYILTLNDLVKLNDLKNTLDKFQIQLIDNMHRSLLQRKSDVNLITIVTRSEELSTLERLIELGANTSLQDEYGVSPIMLAAYTGNKAMLELLINNNADINLPTNDGTTALLVATYIEHHEIMQILIANKANVNLIRNDLTTPLSVALEYHDFVAARILIQAGAILYKNREPVFKNAKQKINDFLYNVELESMVRLKEIQCEISRNFPNDISIYTLQEERKKLIDFYEEFNKINSQFMFLQRYEKKFSQSFNLLNEKISFVSFMLELLTTYPFDTIFKNTPLSQLFNLYTDFNAQSIIDLLSHGQNQNLSDEPPQIDNTAFNFFQEKNKNSKYDRIEKPHAESKKFKI